MRRPGSDCRQVQTSGAIETTMMNKGAWTKQEDEKLTAYVHKHGEGCWRSIPQRAGLHRCGKSCRLRWLNYLKPGLKRGNYGEDEEDLIIKLHALLGNRWSLIAGRLPGRTDNEVKNYWNSHLKRKLLRMGVDPNKHRLHQTLIPCHKEGNTNGRGVRPSEATSRLSNRSTDTNGTALAKGDRTCSNNQMSDYGSCVMENMWLSSNCLPDLNVDIGRTGLSSPSELGVDYVVKGDYQCCYNQSTLLREVEGAAHPATLMLFT